MSVRCLNFNIFYLVTLFCAVRTIWGSSYPYPGLLEFNFNADGTSTLEDVSDTVEGKWEPTEEGLKFGDAQDEYNIIYEDEKLKMGMEHEKGTIMVYFYKYK